jgi:hypothetical protein
LVTHIIISKAILEINLFTDGILNISVKGFPYPDTTLVSDPKLLSHAAMYYSVGHLVQRKALSFRSDLFSE